MTPDVNDPMEREIGDLIRREYVRADAHARIPPPELIWIQAQMRAREEAARKALLPLVIAQAIGIAACVGVLIAIAGRLSLDQLPHIPLLLLEMVVGGWLILAPLAVYVACARD